MGHNENNTKIDVQTNEIKDIFIKMMETTIAILEFQKSITNDEKEQKGLEEWIIKSKNAITTIRNVQHYEILISLYNSFINGKETFFVALCNSIIHKDTIAKWDKTDKGFREFLKKEQEAREEYEKDLKQKKETRDFIAKARAEGKKVEMLYKDGKIKPVIVEEKVD